MEPGNVFICFTNDTVRIHQTFNHKEEGKLNQLNLKSADDINDFVSPFMGKKLYFEKRFPLKHPASFMSNQGEMIDFLQNIIAYKFFDDSGEQFYISSTQMEGQFKKHFKPFFPNSQGNVIIKKPIKVKSENKKIVFLKAGTEAELANVIEWKLNEKNEMVKGFQLWFNNHLYTYWGTDKTFKSNIL